jgi:hypothetical protein
MFISWYLSSVRWLIYVQTGRESSGARVNSVHNTADSPDDFQPSLPSQWLYRFSIQCFAYVSIFVDKIRRRGIM